MPGSVVKLCSQGWLCSSAGDGPGHAGVYWDSRSLKDPRAGIAGTEDSAYCWVGKKRAKAVICKKMNPDHRFRVSFLLGDSPNLGDVLCVSVKHACLSCGGRIASVYLSRQGNLHRVRGSSHTNLPPG